MPSFGAKRLKRDYSLPLPDKTIRKIWKEVVVLVEQSLTGKGVDYLGGAPLFCFHTFYHPKPHFTSNTPVYPDV